MSTSSTINVTLHVWRQNGPSDAGHMEKITAPNVDANMSFLEMLDVVNDRLISAGKEPIAFEYDCREGICGSCSLVINGKPHGPGKGVTTCQLYMRSFQDGDEIFIEPFRAAAFPVIKDLVVDRTAFDRIVQKGGFISVNTGNAVDANNILIPKNTAEAAMDAASCIGCGACVAACKNASAMLFVAAKVSHLGLLPQGQAERARRVRTMVKQMDEEGFGHCTNQYECEATCPKNISVNWIARMNRELLGTSIGDDGEYHGNANTSGTD
jgi:succinate dehydrogenase / fumarate reductase iron-sulfur subunit